MTSDPRERGADAARAFALFDELIELDPGERATRLQEVRTEAPGVADELEALLASDRAAGDFLEQPATESAATLLGSSTHRTIGPWRVVDLLGRGGMGVVYRVERADDQFRQVAALKLVPRALDDEPTRRRFLSERQILARLQHPRIAALLDGGVTDEGQPYFAMELAEGPDLISYCDEERLDIDQRLELFLQVCEGVQHAHRNLVVHRDLKPSNIVVTAHGVKLLDFGIAKLIEQEDPELTQTGTRLLTPSYAAPEQVLGTPITTSTDVYGLGLVLYEMLTGHAAHRLTGEETAAEIERRICELEVPTASHSFGSSQSAEPAALRRTTPERLRRRLRGDLDVILAKALSKDPIRRYDSVESLAADVQRSLDSLPIRARPPSLSYRCARFVRRNALAVAASLMVGMLLLTLFVTQVRSNREIRAALESSRLEAAKARETAEFLSNLFEVANPAVNSGREVSARELLDRGASKIRTELAGQPGVQSALMGEIGWIYNRLGLLENASQIIEEAIAIQAASPATNPLEQAENQHRLSILQDRLGNSQRAEELARKALAKRRELLPADDPAVAESMGQLGSVLAFLGRYEEAEPLAREAVQRLIASVGLEDDRTSTAQHNLAWLLRRIGGTDEAIELYRRVLEVDERRLGRDHPDVLYTSNALAVALRRSGRAREAEDIYVRILESRRRLLGAEHPDVGEALHNLARAQTTLGKLDEAAANFEQAIEVWSHSLPPDHRNFGTVYCNLGDLEARTGNAQRALDRLLHGLGILEATLPAGHARVIDCAIRASTASLDLERWQQSVVLSRRALEVLAQVEEAPVDHALRTARLELLLWLGTRELGGAASSTDGAPPAQAIQSLREHAPEDPLLARVTTSSRPGP